MSISQDIESRIQILDIVNRYVTTKKSGVNYKWLCPFHQEKTPSFVISPTKNIAHCFSCGKGGGPIRFLMEIEKIEFREALHILAKEAWVELKTTFRDQQYEKNKDIYRLYKVATKWYHDQIFLSENTKALEYLLDRGISKKTIQDFSLWYAASSRDLLYFLKNEGFDTAFVIESWLFVGENRDKFFGRITFPIANTMGHTVAFTGRTLTSAIPKYLNSPTSHIFDKSSILYGLHLAKQTIAKSGEVFVVEWQMDTISLYQSGITNVVWISGTALTKDHIRILRRFAKIVYLALDSDDAGVKATFASIENLLNENIEIRIIQIPDNQDPDDFISSGWDFLELRKSSLGVIDFYLHEWWREYNMDTLIGKKQLIEKCLEIVISLKSQLEVDFYLQQISSWIGVGMEALYSEYKKCKRTTLNRNRKPQNTEDDSFPQSPISFSLSQMIAGYIYRYQFLNLFSSKFQYTVSDLRYGTDNGLLIRILSDTLDPEDNEILRIIDLHIEEEHIDANSDLIERAFWDLLRRLHVELFQQEKERRLSQISPHDVWYNALYQELLEKEIKMWLRK